MFKAKQQISKEHDQLKEIQQTLQLISMDIERNPFKSHNMGQASRPGDPASFFRNHQQEDLFLHDPDVWGPPPAKDTKGGNGGRIGTANRKLEANKRNANTKSATAAVAPIKRNGTKPLSRVGTAKAGTSKNGKENGDSNKNGGGEKTDKSEKDDENEEEKTPERKFEAASHADIDLVDMLGKLIFLTSFT